MSKASHHSDSVLHSKLLLMLVIIASIVFASATGYYYTMYKETRKDARVLGDAATDTKALLSEIGQIMELPSGENPTIATVTEKDKLQKTDFFRKAENGDKVVSYGKAGLVILYRPSTHKIIQTGPAIFQQAETPTPAVTSGTPAPTVTRVPTAANATPTVAPTAPAATAAPTVAPTAVPTP